MNTTNNDYQALLQQRAELEAQIAATLKTEKAAAIAQARALATQFGLTPADVFTAPNKAPASVGQPKYRNPETGATWTGRGKPPNWINGKDREIYRIGK
jgi:DNA-binding protein H-NS